MIKINLGAHDLTRKDNAKISDKKTQSSEHNQGQAKAQS